MSPLLKNTPNVRESSMECLRILAIAMVVTLHYTSRVRNIVATEMMNYYFNEILTHFSIVGVNCFVLLSGYFGIHSKSLKLRRIINLLLVIAFFGALFYIASVFAGLQTFSTKDLILACVPYVKGGLWFVRVYIVLEFLSPFLNYALNRFSSKQHLSLCIVLLAIFSVWPSLPNPIVDDGGFGIVHFITLYAIGSYLRLHFSFSVKWWVYLLIYVACALIDFGCNMIGWPNSYACYDFLFNIISACSLLMMFASWHFKSPLINFVASASFGVYIIHEGAPFSDILYQDVLKINSVAFSPQYPILALLSIFGQLAGCFILVVAQMLLFRVTVDKIIDKLPFLNKQLFNFNNSDR